MANHAHQVLVVEDDPDIRQVVMDMLEGEGFAVLGAEHGAVALEFLRAGRRPCVVVLDLMMPVMDGWTFCQEIDKEPALATIPIVVMSAIAQTDPRNRCIRAAARLTKPMDLDRLLRAVRDQCHQRAAR